ncbi:MAG: hypothetical protein HOP08_03240 [Cyclobacteriaceae bacterium]|nr:hypothetical protein [Cyclobacteriaceae bacterium]
MTYPTIELSKYSDNASIRNENDVYVLKTNILSQQDVTLLTRFLSEEYRIKKWSVDLNDIDRVFRVESQQLKLSDIQQLVHRAGYSCEELPD